MNAFQQSTPTAFDYGAAPKLSRPMQAGIAVSILLHALLFLAFRTPPSRHAGSADASASRSLVVWVRSPTAPEAAPMPAAAPRKRSAFIRPRAITSVPDTTAESAQAIQAAAPAENRAPALAQATESQDDVARAHDLIEKSHKLARVYAREGDPSHATNPITLAESKRMMEPKLARDVAHAKRRDCKDGLPGGLLAPIFLLLEKKDSGCKW